jgi:acylphosphatase
MSDLVRVQVLISGTVQGVNYRWFVVDKATALGLSGWVRNLSDGRVEAEIEGDRDPVNQLVDAMRVGPRMANVTDLQQISLSPEGRSKEFRVRY